MAECCTLVSPFSWTKVQFVAPPSGSIVSGSEQEAIVRLVLGMMLMLMAPVARAAEDIRVAWLGMGAPADRPFAFVDGPAPADDGLAGLRQAIADNNGNGRFVKQRFSLHEAVLAADGDAVAALAGLAQAGYRFVVADLPAAVLSKAAADPRAAGLTILNAGAPDDGLRNQGCRANLLHTLPSRAMRADALAQFLVRKNWKKWALVAGAGADDQAFAAALRRAAAKFGAKVVADKQWDFSHDARRTAEGEVAVFTQGLSYDVLVIADEAGGFGDLFPYNTWDPRPVAGTQGLVATSWHPAHEQWGAIQMQNRFRAATGRAMSVKDHAAWQAGRAVGEAAMKARSTDPTRIRDTLYAPDFQFAAFKGRPLGFRPWDGQLRQPMLLAWARAMVAVAPQEGFLHPITDLDTLGHDKGDSTCAARS
jgi:ABC transporter substrate binding protein (PQQ-dependent alcohol dehydrogenase system)